MWFETHAGQRMDCELIVQAVFSTEFQREDFWRRCRDETIEELMADMKEGIIQTLDDDRPPGKILIVLSAQLIVKDEAGAK